jgi:hypothetical protein
VRESPLKPEPALSGPPVLEGKYLARFPVRYRSLLRDGCEVIKLITGGHDGFNSDRKELYGN